MLVYVLSALSAVQYSIIIYLSNIYAPPDSKYSIVIDGFSYCNIIGGDKYPSTAQGYQYGHGLEAETQCVAQFKVGADGWNEWKSRIWFG